LSARWRRDLTRHARLVGVDATLGPVMEGAVRHHLDRFEKLLRQAGANGEIRDSGDLRRKAIASRIC
jgi:hypothetical protein